MDCEKHPEISIQVINAESGQYLKTMPDNSIDAVVTDPPYGLRFMNKHWDYDLPSVALWQEVLRVLKPGGHLLSFGGTRTYHRMVVGIEDAGFEIRDQLQWIYGSGFPKSLNVGKEVDEIQGNERKVIKKLPPGTGPLKTGHAEKGGGGGFMYEERSPELTVTKGNSPWEGWGTGLKPANEPICLARKPISEKNIAENILKWGTGALNIDACRIPFSGKKDFDSSTWGRGTNILGGNYVGAVHGDGRTNIESNPAGRFPANVIIDESEEVNDLFPETSSGLLKAGTPYNHSNCNTMGDASGVVKQDYGNTSGSAARFFYCAKASRNERNRGLEGFEIRPPAYGVNFSGGSTGSISNTKNPAQNYHPTVKPVSLMCYLIRLITPPGGTVLDPFGGSGTTGIGCKVEKRNCILIEREYDFCEISKARINGWEIEKQENIAADTQLSFWD